MTDTMQAALVESFQAPPRLRTVPRPAPHADREVMPVLAAGVHPITRGIASGRHYASDGELPLIPGIDGVVRLADGGLGYAMGMRLGSLAEQLEVPAGQYVRLPEGSDPTVIAATMNPAISSWVVLCTRVGFNPGGTVLVLGATGGAGSMAVAVARRLGAGRVVAAGRDPERLAATRGLGADELVRIDGSPQAGATALVAAAGEADVVLDYLWGPIAGATLAALAGSRTDPARPLDWVQIGSSAGASLELAAETVRSAAIRISGSGYGAVPGSTFQAEFARLAEVVATGAVSMTPHVRPLSQVENAWSEGDPEGARLVLVPGS